MSKEPFIPPRPYIDPPSQEAIEHLKSMTKEDHKAFKKSNAYKKRVLPALKRHKQQKRLKRQEWWWAKGLQILNLILALIAAITGILAFPFEVRYNNTTDCANSRVCKKGGKQCRIPLFVHFLIANLKLSQCSICKIRICPN